MPVTLTYSRVGPGINETPINVSLQQLAAKFNAGITDSDISANANIAGTKIAPGTLPNTAIVATSITAAQIANGTITTTQVATGAGALLGSNIAASTILWGNLKFGSYDWTPGGAIGAGGSLSINTGLLYANTRSLGMMIENTTLGTLAFISYGVFHNPTDDKLSLYLANNSGGTVTLGATIFRFFYILLS